MQSDPAPQHFISCLPAQLLRSPQHQICHMLFLSEYLPNCGFSCPNREIFMENQSQWNWDSTLWWCWFVVISPMSQVISSMSISHFTHVYMSFHPSNHSSSAKHTFSEQTDRSDHCNEMHDKPHNHCVSRFVGLTSAFFCSADLNSSSSCLLSYFLDFGASLGA